MERMIDADSLLNEAEYDNNFRLIIPADKVKNAPTITLPNEPLTPCDMCMFSPPSSGDGKPCCMCPAVSRQPEE